MGRISCGEEGLKSGDIKKNEGGDEYPGVGNLIHTWDILLGY